MISSYVPLVAPVLGCTHAEPYARVQARADVLLIDGKSVLGPIGGRVVISYKIGYEQDGKFVHEPKAPDQEVILEGESLAVLRMYTHRKGAPLGDFRDGDVLAFVTKQIPQEDLVAAKIALDEWKTAHGIPLTPQQEN